MAVNTLLCTSQNNIVIKYIKKGLNFGRINWELHTYVYTRAGEPELEPHVLVPLEPELEPETLEKKPGASKIMRLL